MITLDEIVSSRLANKMLWRAANEAVIMSLRTKIKTPEDFLIKRNELMEQVFLRVLDYAIIVDEKKENTEYPCHKVFAEKEETR